MTRNFTHTSNFLFITNLFGKETTYYIQGVNLPGLNFSHIETSHRGGNLKLQGDTLVFNDLILNFIIDENLTVWKEITEIMLKMRKPDNGSFTSKEDYKKYSYLEIHDDNSNKILKLEFIDSRIESIEDLMFSTNNSDEIITCTVYLKYDYYNIIL